MAIAEEFNLTAVDNGIRHEDKDRSFIVYNYNLNENTNLSIVKATVNQDVKIIREPHIEDQQTLITLSNFSTNYNPEKPEFLATTGDNFQVSITNSAHANSLNIPQRKEVIFVTFRIKNSHLQKFEGLELTRYKELLREDEPFYMYHFLPHKTEKLVHKLFSFDGPKDWRRLMKLSVTYEILADIYMLLRANEPVIHKDVNPVHLKQALNIQSYILENLNIELTVEKVAEQFAMSESALHKVFKKVLSVSPYNFIKKERLKRSRDLLISSDFSVTQIAFQLNFSSPSHFVSTFKSEFGMTPALMRQSHLITA